MLPSPAQLPQIPTFTPATHAASGLELLAAVAASDVGTQDKQVALTTEPATLHTMGPYNPAAALPPKVVKRILALVFVEMADLKADIWPEHPSPQDGSSQSRRQPAKPPVNNIRVWMECYARMAAILATRFPEKAPELWAYQTTIGKVAHTYEGSNWVLYDRQYRRDMLTRKDLNWSVPNTRLYNEAFTGRVQAIPRCPHCLFEDHTAVMCLFNPNSPDCWLVPRPAAVAVAKYTDAASGLRLWGQHSPVGGVPE